MVFKIQNFGKIAEASVKLDGITVICGNNNTGKSTVGKALFAFFNALNDYQSKIFEQKSNKIRMTIRNSLSNILELPAKVFSPDSSLEFIAQHNNEFTLDEVKAFIENYYSVKIPKEKLVSLVTYLNTSENDILNEYVFRYVSSIMNGQIKNVFATNNSRCSITGQIKDFSNSIEFKKQSCICSLSSPIDHSAYYINTPFSLDNLNEHRLLLFESNQMNRSVVNSILQAQAEINDDSMTNILDSVINKKELDTVREVIKKAYHGSTKFDHGRFYFVENGVSFDFRNLSAGLKSFAIIERLLETGVLKRKDVLILDEPEIHLHTEWQMIYAELIVILQKAFDLTILLVTHSFQFLESLSFYMKQYGISSKGSYYLPEATDKGCVIRSCSNSPDELKQNLIKGSIKLADYEFEYDMRNNQDDYQDN